MKKEQRFEILLEEVRDSVRTVAEGHGVLQRQIGALHGEMNDRFWEVDLEFEALNGKIDVVAADLKEHRVDTEAHVVRATG